MEKIKERVLCSVMLSSENRTVCETMWGKYYRTGRPQITIWRMRVACYLPKATNTHPEYVILNAFPLQQWLHERVSLLR